MPKYQIRLATPTDADAIARAHVESWKSTYAGIMPGPFLATLSVAQRAAYWKQILQEMHSGGRKRVWVAIDEAGALVGLLAGGESRDPDLFEYDAELYAIYLLREHQRKGLGRRLIAEFSSWVRSLGLANFFLWVLEGNPYEPFYPRVGGRRLEISKPIEFGGKLFRERAYGWDELG